MTAPARTPRCPLCGSEQFEPLLVGFDRRHARRDDYPYTRCRGCRLVSLNPPPQGGDPSAFYPDDYAPHRKGSPGGGEVSLRARFAARHRFATSAAAAPRGWQGVLHRAAGWLEPRLVEPRGAHRLLDVGCGAGEEMARYAALGWTVRGIDPSAAAVEACRGRGLSARQGSILDADLPSRHFDLVLLHHVIEHVPRPAEALARARELLAPGGAVVIVTPNAAGLGMRLYGSCWHALDAPRHLHLFDRATLVRTCETAGFSVRELQSVSSSRVLASSRHTARTQGPVLPPGHAAREAALARSRSEPPSRSFRRFVSPVAHAAAWLGYGETLRAVLEDPGRRG